MISYEISGGGATAPVLVLVHGFAQDRRYFAGAVPALSERYRVLQVDLRGHGASSAHPGPFGLAEHAEDVAEVLDHEGVSGADLWATHTGTAVGLVLATTRPALLGRLVLEGAVLPGYPMPRTEWLEDHAGEVARDKGVAAAVEDLYENGEWFSYVREHLGESDAGGLRAMLADFGGAPLLSTEPPREVPEVYAELGELPHRLLVYNGEEDLPEYLEVATVLAESVNDAVQEEIAGAGSFPLWEDPPAVLRLVLDFLS